MTPGRLSSILEEIIQFAQSEERTISVLILNRYKFESIFDRYNNLKQRFGYRKELSLRFSTIHSLKGGEADFVIIDDINSGLFGLPNRMGEDSVLNMVLNKPEDFQDAEERRLFYVALTRCKERLYLLSVQGKESDFLEEVTDFISPTTKIICPNCSGKMIERRNRETGETFMGCVNFPICSHTKN